MAVEYAKSVFVNCPFHDGYREMMEAIVFAVHDAGFVARSALETDGADAGRLPGILHLIRESKYGIHDLSMTDLDPRTGLPRFNMPFEFGLFLGFKEGGSKKHKEKGCLVLDREQYRYREFLSDIAGRDIRAHAGDPALAIGQVRNFLRNQTPGVKGQIPGQKRMAERYEKFRALLPRMCREFHLELDDLEFNDYTTIVVEWLRRFPWGVPSGTGTRRKQGP